MTQSKHVQDDNQIGQESPNEFASLAQLYWQYNPKHLYKGVSSKELNSEETCIGLHCKLPFKSGHHDVLNAATEAEENVIRVECNCEAGKNKLRMSISL